MKAIVTALALLFFTSLLFSQSTFQLGFTGAYPNYFDTATKDINWSYYSDLNLNTIQGWWAFTNIK